MVEFDHFSTTWTIAINTAKPCGVACDWIRPLLPKMVEYVTNYNVKWSTKLAFETNLLFFSANNEDVRYVVEYHN